MPAVTNISKPNGGILLLPTAADLLLVISGLAWLTLVVAVAGAVPVISELGELEVRLSVTLCDACIADTGLAGKILVASSTAVWTAGFSVVGVAGVSVAGDAGVSVTGATMLSVLLTAGVEFALIALVGT
jgi:hypothetical protein